MNIHSNKAGLQPIRGSVIHSHMIDFVLRTVIRSQIDNRFTEMTAIHSMRDED